MDRSLTLHLDHAFPRARFDSRFISAGPAAGVVAAQATLARFSIPEGSMIPSPSNNEATTRMWRIAFVAINFESY
jgi:hypothetical protein